MMVIGLCFATTFSFAEGFGVDDSQGSSASINQLLGQSNSQTVSTPAKGALSMSQIGAIVHQNTSSQKAQTAAATANQPSLGDQAFANTAHSLMPLSPNQIKQLRQRMNDSQQAAADYPGVPPKPTSSSISVNLSPGATPPVVRLRDGFVTSLVFLDSTGEPWPIQAYDIGDPGSFNVQWNQKGNTLLVQSNKAYKSGNLAVILKGDDTPVMVTLMPGQRAVDYRVDMRVPGLGPNASALQSGLPDTANPQLLSFLNGIPPNGAKALQVQGGPCQAWTSGGHLYLRTQLTVLSPSWLASMSSPDGTHVYEIMKSPVVLASFRGKDVQLMIQGL